MDENSKKNSRIKKRIIITVVVFLFFGIFVFAFEARQNEHLVVGTVSDFYVSFLNNNENFEQDTQILVTSQFRGVIESSKVFETVTCGFINIDEVSVNSGVAFWNNGSVNVDLREGVALREAVVFLKKIDGNWFIDAIACH